MQTFLANVLRYTLLGALIIALLFVVMLARGEAPWQTSEQWGWAFAKYMAIVAGAALAVSVLMQVFKWLGWKEVAPTKRSAVDLLLGVGTLGVLLFFLVRS